ncbi:hypothetical protein BH24ACT15_BH24ACT15_29870 [soil metagenome]
MPNEKGSRKERQTKALYVEAGYYVSKAGGSLGAADLVCLKAGEPPVLAQVKATAAGPWSHFGPAERAELVEVAAKAGAVAVLVWWAQRKPPQYIAPADWP